MCLFVKRKYDIGTAQIHLLLKENMKIRGLVKRFQQIVVDFAGNKDNIRADYVSRPAKSRQIIYKFMNIFLCLCYLWLQCQCTSGPKNGTDCHALAGVVSDFRMISVLVQTKFIGILHTGNRMLLDSNLMDGFCTTYTKDLY